MAEQIFSADPGSLTAPGSYAYSSDDFGATAQQPGYYSWVDDEANQGPTGETVGGDGDDFSGGAEHAVNPAMPGTMSNPGLPGPDGGPTSGSTGIVGDVING